MSDDTRIERFRSELAELKTATSKRSAEQFVLWLSIVMMVAGVAIAFGAYLSSHQQNDPRAQYDMIVLALAGVSTAVVGGALYLRQSLTRFLRFWLVRQLYENQSASREVAVTLVEERID